MKVNNEYETTDFKAAHAGIYKVKKKSIVDAENPEYSWQVSDKLDIVESNYIYTKNLAVNGYCENIDDAARYMSQFIQHGFGEGALKNAYTLFFNPCHGAINDAVIDRQAEKNLAAVLECIGNSKGAVNLTVHEAGHALFYNALREVIQRGQSLENITVFYANATSNLQLVDNLRKQCKMKLSANPPLINPLCLKQNIISGNFVSAVAVAGRSGNGMASHVVNLIFALGAVLGLGQIGVKVFGMGGWVVALVPIALAQYRAQSKQVIINGGQAFFEGGRRYGKKLIWDPVHKMMVKQ